MMPSPSQLKDKKHPLGWKIRGKVPCNPIASAHTSVMPLLPVPVAPQLSSWAFQGPRSFQVQHELTPSCKRLCCSIMKACIWRRESQENFLPCSIKESHFPSIIKKLPATRVCAAPAASCTREGSEGEFKCDTHPSITSEAFLNQRLTGACTEPSSFCGILSTSSPHCCTKLAWLPEKWI